MSGENVLVGNPKGMVELWYEIPSAHVPYTPRLDAWKRYYRAAGMVLLNSDGTERLVPRKDNASAFTATRVIFAATGGYLTDDAGLTFNAASDLLTVTGAGGGAQLRLAYDGSNYAELQVTSNGDFRLIWTGTQAYMEKASAGNALRWFLHNTDNTNVASSARFQVQAGGASAGDAYFQVTIGGNTDWVFGADNSDSDKFKISQSTALGTNAFLTITTGGRIGLLSSGTSPAFDIEAVKAGELDFVLRCSNASNQAQVRLFNDQNSALRAATFTYTGSTYAGAWWTGGPTGEQGAIGTTGAFPLVFGTNNTYRAQITSAGDVGIGTTTPNNNGYNLALSLASTGATGLELVSTAADATDTELATMLGWYATNSAGHRAITAIQTRSDGATVNQRGGAIVFYTKPNAVTAQSERMRITSAGRIGIGMSGPDRRVDILDASGDPQLRLTYTDGTVYGEFEADSSGNLLVLCTGNNFSVFTNTAGATVTTRAEHNDNTNGASHARLIALTGGASGGDPATLYTVNGVSDFIQGIDNSDSDRYKVCSGSAIGTNDALTITSGLSVILNNAAIATTATDGFLYVATCAGAPTGVPTSFTGRAPIVIDTTNNKLYFYSSGAWRDAGP